jgi:cephalosporin hydroxylase
MNKFEKEVFDRTKSYQDNADLIKTARLFQLESVYAKYSYNFHSLGRPIIQYPQDIVAIQEIIWKVRPDLIIETGIAHGGSLIMSASMLALLDICDAQEKGLVFNSRESKRKVLGIDIDIRSENRIAIEKHPMSSRIQMIEGSSIESKIIKQVEKVANNYKCVMVLLDSNHTHDHVLTELNSYAPLVSLGSYCVVFDTIIEDLPKNVISVRPWGPGNSPKTAIAKYLRKHPEFQIDKNIQNKLLITVAPDGYLKKIK